MCACCDYCGHEETSLHVLRDCGLAMGVWMDGDDMRDTFFEGNSNYWFQIIKLVHILSKYKFFCK
jgi:hypothetical protein